MILALLSLLALQSAAPPPLPALVNPDLEQVDESGRPTGWAAIEAQGVPAFQFGLVPGETGGRAGRIARAQGATSAAANGGVIQRIDAEPYRGRIVRLSARVRAIRPGDHAALALRVVRPAPKTGGFRDSMPERPITANDWRSYEIRGRVAPDARMIEISVVGSGDAELLFDDVSLQAVEPNPAPPSPAAAAYLDQAIDRLRRHHIDSPVADWNRIVADARAEIGGARTPADTYPAIRGVIGALGEPHTFLLTPNANPRAAARAGGARQRPRLLVPRFKLVEGRFGAVQVPQHFGTEAESSLYARTLRQALETLDSHGICGWIVDLRGNGGGNMWPMLTGLDPLLGPAPFGSFVSPGAEAAPWVRYRGQIRPGPRSDREAPFFALRAADRPVAILIDGVTSSSGEMTAIAFIGRPRARTFGATSRGYTTANHLEELPDGAAIAVTSAFVRDRRGRDYRTTVEPDEPAADAQAAALRWLAAQPCH
jgi:hypothetical protein